RASALLPYTTLFRSVGVEAAQAGLVRVEELVPSLGRCEPDPWVEGWTGGPADQSEVDGVVDRSGGMVRDEVDQSGPVEAAGEPRSEEHTSELQSREN